MSYKVREIQSTPNPNALKFVLDGEISSAPMSFLSSEQAQGHPIASQIFAISGVTSVLLLGDFVTVNKQPQTEWKVLTKKVQEILEKS